MHAYLFIGDQKLLSQAKEFNIITANTVCIEYELKKISDTKKIIQETNLKTSKKIVYIIRDIDQASQEAQNSFLKRLEEPQENITFVLTCRVEDAVLETITSRCQVVYLTKAKKTETNSKDNSDFLTKTISEQLLYIDTLQSRPEAIDFLVSLTPYAKQKESAVAVQTTLLALYANTNLSLQLTNFVVKLTSKSS